MWFFKKSTATAVYGLNSDPIAVSGYKLCSLNICLVIPEPLYNHLYLLYGLMIPINWSQGKPYSLVATK